MLAHSGNGVVRGVRRLDFGGVDSVFRVLGVVFLVVLDVLDVLDVLVVLVHILGAPVHGADVVEIPTRAQRETPAAARGPFSQNPLSASVRRVFW